MDMIGGIRRMYSRGKKSEREISRITGLSRNALVSIEGNRYSVPFALIGKTVQVVREGGHWVMRHRSAVIAQHPVLAGRAQMSVYPEHGPGAAMRNARKRYADLTELPALHEPVLHAGREVQVRELAIYDQLLEAA